MDCKNINIRITATHSLDRFSAVDDAGNYVFYNILGSDLAAGITYSVGSTVSSIRLTGSTQSGFWTNCNTGIANYDQDAFAFIQATGLTTSVITGVSYSVPAIYKLVTDLKSNNLWSSFKAIYPFVGATESAHMLNLMNPVDSNAAFRSNFSTDIVHTINGVKGTTTSAGILTGLAISSQLPGSSILLSYYSRTLAATSSNSMAFAAGSGALRCHFYGQFNNTVIAEVCGGASRITATAIGTKGYFVTSRTNANDVRFFFNGTQSGYSTAINGALPTQGLGMLYQPSNNSLHSDNQWAFATIGTGLTASDVTILSTIVNQFQMDCQRAVY